MLTLEIKPGHGAGDLRLGQSRATVRRLMQALGYSPSYEADTVDYFCENALQVEYEDGCARFIGISDHPQIRCTYRKLDVFNVDADALGSAFARDEPTVPSVTPGDGVFFPGLGITLWEAHQDYDRKGGHVRPVYAQIGVERPARSRTGCRGCAGPGAVGAI